MTGLTKWAIHAMKTALLTGAMRAFATAVAACLCASTKASSRLLAQSMAQQLASVSPCNCQWTFVWHLRKPASGLCSPVVGSCQKHVQAGSCHGLWAFLKLWNGATQAAYSTQKKPCAVDWCASFMSPKICYQPHAQLPVRSLKKPQLFLYPLPVK